MAIVGSSTVLMRPFKKAIETREILDERHGSQTDFTPSMDGSMTSERMDAFLAVRSVLMPACTEFTASDTQFERLDELDENASTQEILSEFWDVSGTVINMGTQMGEFFNSRNQALSEANMGRGEYTYVYTLAYMARLRPPGEKREDPNWGSKHPNPRVRLALKQMLINQQQAFNDPSHTVEDLEQSDIERSLRFEIQKLDEDSHRLPWQDGLPTQITQSFAPYRGRLDELYCDSTVVFEFTENQQTFLGIEGK